MINKKCELCNNTFSVIESRKNKARFCSKECATKSKEKRVELVCSECGSTFYKRPSLAKRSIKHGNFCSSVCMASYRRRCYLGSNNPNFKKSNYDSDGYKITHLETYGMVKLHKHVVLTYLGLKSIKKGYHIHHRDCDIYNNTPDNLVVLSVEEHQWLHKQFGIASLHAYSCNKITIDELASWSDNKEKALKLLNESIITQKEIGVFKFGELLESCDANQQPSSENDNIVSEKVQRLTGEESTNNPDTSAEQSKFNPDEKDIYGKSFNDHINIAQEKLIRSKYKFD